MAADLVHGSLHEALHAAGHHPRRGTGTIVAEPATSEDARLLALRPGDPLLVERRVIVDAHAHPIEATESRYAARRYALDVTFDVEERPATAEPNGG
jgi:GntR family transcriptional regulator